MYPSTKINMEAEISLTYNATGAGFAVDSGR